MSEFGSSFERSFAIHRAISAAVREADAAQLPIEMSDVLKHLEGDAPIAHAPDIVAAILSAARDAGTSIVIGEPPRIAGQSPPDALYPLSLVAINQGAAS